MKLSELIEQLKEVYNNEGEMNVAIIRAGIIYKEIEIYVDNDYLSDYKSFMWLEAYKPDELV